MILNDLCGELITLIGDMPMWDVKTVQGPGGIKIKEWGKGVSSILGVLQNAGMPNWCDPDQPAKIMAGIAALKGPPGGVTIPQIFGFWNNAAGKISIPDWYVDGGGGAPGIVSQTVLAVLYGGLWLLDWVWQAPMPGGCNIGRLKAMSLTSMMLFQAGKWFGIPTDILEKQYEYNRNYLCPQEAPATHEALQAYLHNTLTLAATYVWANANGHCNYKVDLQIDAAKHRHSPREIMELWFRGYVGSETELHERLRGVGMIDSTVRDEFIALSKPIPSEATIKHWLKVCRPGRCDDAIVYTETEARRDLRYHGWDETNIERILYARKMNVATRHMLMPYYEDIIPRRDVEENLIDDGFMPRDIDMLFRFYEYEKQQHRMSNTGALGTKQMVSKAAQGELTEFELNQQMRLWGYSDAMVQEAYQQVRNQQGQDIRSAGIQAVQADLKAGKVSADEAAISLAGYGVSQHMAATVIAKWSLEANIAHKPASIGQLCEWATKGWISISEYKKRLRVLGWTGQDILRIIAMCGLKAREKEQKLLAANAKRQQGYAAKKILGNRAAAGIVPVAALPVDPNQVDARIDGEGQLVPAGPTPEELADIAAQAGVDGAEKVLGAIQGTLSGVEKRQKQLTGAAAKSAAAKAKQEAATSNPANGTSAAPVPGNPADPWKAEKADINEKLGATRQAESGVEKRAKMRIAADKAAAQQTDDVGSLPDDV